MSLKEEFCIFTTFTHKIFKEFIFILYWKKCFALSNSPFFQFILQELWEWIFCKSEFSLNSFPRKTVFAACEKCQLIAINITDISSKGQNIYVLLFSLLFIYNFLFDSKYIFGMQKTFYFS